MPLCAALATVLPYQSPGDSGHCGRETWPAHPRVPFTTPGVLLSLCQAERSPTVGPRNACGCVQGEGVRGWRVRAGGGCVQGEGVCRGRVRT